jgi:hypothetical protein
MMRWARLTLQRHTALAKIPSGEYAKQLVEFQGHNTKIRKQHMCTLGHVRNAEQTQVFFDVLLNISMEEKVQKQF